MHRAAEQEAQLPRKGAVEGVGDQSAVDEYDAGRSRRRRVLFRRGEERMHFQVCVICRF
ncbi:MAG: hypothetical protein NVSMB43_12770 [Pseudarthrobacter sp.]